jgi:hypothetical protein
MAPINVAMDATILSSLMSCGCVTDYKYNQNLTPKGGKSNSLEVGSIVHTFFEYYYQGKIDKRSKSDCIDLGMAAAKLYIKGCDVCQAFPIDQTGHPPCGHKNADFIGVVNTPQKSEKRGKQDLIGWEWALDTCIQYLAHYVNDSFTVLASEHTKSDLIYEAEDIRILWKAKFDLIIDSGQIIPVDHKTMKQRRDSLSLNNQFMGQCVLMKSRNMIVDKIGFQTSLKPSEKFERAMMSYSKSRLDEWQNEIVPYWARVLVSYSQNGIWPRNFTHCENKYGFCEFKEVCSSDKNMRNEVIALNFVKRRAWDVTND